MIKNVFSLSKRMNPVEDFSVINCSHEPQHISRTTKNVTEFNGNKFQMDESLEKLICSDSKDASNCNKPTVIADSNRKEPFSSPLSLAVEEIEKKNFLTSTLSIPNRINLDDEKISNQCKLAEDQGLCNQSVQFDANASNLDDDFKPEELLNIDGTSSVAVRSMSRRERKLVLHKRRLRNRISAKKSRERRIKTISSMDKEISDGYAKIQELITYASNILQSNKCMLQSISNKEK